MEEGWVCPKCKSCISPLVKVCPKCESKNMDESTKSLPGVVLHE